MIRLDSEARLCFACSVTVMTLGQILMSKLGRCRCLNCEDGHDVTQTIFFSNEDSKIVQIYWNFFLEMGSS